VQQHQQQEAVSLLNQHVTGITDPTAWWVHQPLLVTSSGLANSIGINIGAKFRGNFVNFADE
jgi:hypothetical protein